MSTTPFDPTVRVTDSGPFLVIDNPPPGVVGQFAVGRLELVGAGAGVVMEKKALFRKQNAPSGGLQAVMWAGLLSPLLGLFKLHRVPVTYTNDDTPVNTSTGASVSNTTDVSISISTRVSVTTESITDPAVVSLAATAPRGLVRYDANTIDPLWLIAQVCIGLPGARIVVVVRTWKDATDLKRLLKHHGISAALTGDLAAKPNARVVITLLGQLGMVELNKADVVLVADPLGSTWDDPLTADLAPDPNAPGAGGRRPVGLMERVADAGPARVFGLLPLQRRRSPFERARSWQLFGMDELVLPGPGCVERSVIVARIAAYTAETSKYGVGYVKNRVRTNPRRNRRLAALARGLRGGDVQELRRLAPASALAGFADKPRHVLVLAENLKQAEALKKHLPGWPLVSGLGDATVEDEATGATRGVIATALGAEALAGDEYDVIVRADPGDGPPPLPPGWLSTVRTPAPRVLLVDVEDAGSHRAALWSRRRQRHYRWAGWAFLDEDPGVSAWKRFSELIHERRDWS